MADTPTGETVTPVAPSNDPAPSPAPVTDNTTNPDVEAAKKDAEQARMRANQLENELAKFRADQEEARRKELEKNQEWQKIAETEKERADRLERDQQESELRQRTTAATDELFKQFPAEVVEVAKVTGLSLSDDSDAAKSALTEKLNAIKEKVAPGAPTAGSNNPHNPAPETVDRKTLVTPGADGVSPMAMAGATGDSSVVRKYIRTLPAIEEMKRMAGIKPTDSQ